MESSKSKQTALVYCVYVACGDTIFSPCNEFVHDYRMYDRCAIAADMGIEAILKEIDSVLCIDDLHVFYLPFTDRIRRVLSTHGIQFHSVLPESDCLEEWVGRMYNGKYPDAIIADTKTEWTKVVTNATEYPNEKIIRLSHNNRLSSVPVKNMFEDHENTEDDKHHEVYQNLFLFPYMMMSVFLLFGFMLLLSTDALSDEGVIIFILIFIGSPLVTLLLENQILKLWRRKK